MKIIQLKYFKAICDYNGVSKAAEALFVTQPAITIAIKNLEEEFGVSLFNRNSNKFELTDAGKFLLSKIDVVLNNIEDLESSMKDITNQINSIKLGMPSMIGTFLFSNLIYDFKDKYNDINFEVNEKGSLEVVRDVENGLLDIGIASCKKSDLNNNIEFIELLETELYVAVNKNHILANKKSVTLQDLSNYPLILFNKGSYQYQNIINSFARESIIPNIMLNTYQLNTINQCLQKDNCVAFVYKDTLKFFDNCVGLKLEKHAFKVKIGIVYNKNNVQSKNVKLFLEHCKEIYKK